MELSAARRRLVLALAAAVAPTALAVGAWILDPRVSLAMLAAGAAVAALVAFASLRGVRRALDDARAEAEEARLELGAEREEAGREAAAVEARTGDLDRGNRDLSERIRTQASAIEQVAASMGQLAAGVKHNTESARATQAILAQAGAATARAIEAATQVVARMESVRESSAKVSDIVGLIDGIAFQTNILALNAAVEAARAGEHGRGFAVVATEVRSLSQRAAAAAHEIKALTTTAASQVSESSEEVDQVAEAIAEINGLVSKVNGLMNAVVTAGADQSSGIAQVGRSIQELEHATRRNTSLLERMEPRRLESR